MTTEKRRGFKAQRAGTVNQNGAKIAGASSTPLLCMANPQFGANWQGFLAMKSPRMSDRFGPAGGQNFGSDQ
ncbi:hypothetical protein [Mobiluncus curtisii]|uniref:Uncharacterized protein n=1 Tax=Mobiluncus curtisii (strain ATCC 43063 / DSM 2711 / V125) TaxID=548479 RepID=D6ZL47_MOBCV|nr:hypothetical protein [Mobiluncus curtisii]ADI67446.1 hypothetical protein HMPREF0573_11127 [Mobiluncus curtisii ATCC 43063]NMW88676.1 dihydroorotate dehydrogenase [Mobiluncus curtisii]QQU08825.1 dihydroorotate dehydrogenase [Mobiluncus curtisii]